MPSTSEAAWNDLYNGLADVIGPDRAETLMTHLLRDDHQLATRAQLAEFRESTESRFAKLESDIIVLQADVSNLKSDVSDVKSDIKSLNRNLVSGLILVLATMISVLFAVL